MDLERFEEYMLQMAAKHEQRMAQIDEKIAEINQVQAGIAIGHARLQADLAAWASRSEKEWSASRAEAERSRVEAETSRAEADRQMAEIRQETRNLLSAIHQQTITLDRLMDRQTRHEQDPNAHSLGRAS